MKVHTKTREKIVKLDKENILKSKEWSIFWRLSRQSCDKHSMRIKQRWHNHNFSKPFLSMKRMYRIHFHFVTRFRIWSFNGIRRYRICKKKKWNKWSTVLSLRYQVAAHIEVSEQRHQRRKAEELAFDPWAHPNYTWCNSVTPVAAAVLNCVQVATRANSQALFGRWRQRLDAWLSPCAKHWMTAPKLSRIAARTDGMKKEMVIEITW